MDPSTTDGTDEPKAPQPGPGMPRWVRTMLIIGITLVLALVITRLAGVQHGPSLHRPPGGHPLPADDGP